jgi:hypothetical protein
MDGSGTTRDAFWMWGLSDAGAVGVVGEAGFGEPALGLGVYGGGGRESLEGGIVDEVTITAT